MCSVLTPAAEDAQAFIRGNEGRAFPSKGAAGAKVQRNKKGEAGLDLGLVSYKTSEQPWHVRLQLQDKTRRRKAPRPTLHPSDETSGRRSVLKTLGWRRVATKMFLAAAGEEGDRGQPTVSERPGLCQESEGQEGLMKILVLSVGLVIPNRVLNLNPVFVYVCLPSDCRVSALLYKNTIHTKVLLDLSRIKCICI